MRWLRVRLQVSVPLFGLRGVERVGEGSELGLEGTHSVERRFYRVSKVEPGTELNEGVRLIVLQRPYC